VIMVSAHTRRGAEVTIQALRDGAFDFVAKPSGPRPEENLRTLGQQLHNKIQLFLGGRSRKVARIHSSLPAVAPPPPRSEATATGRRPQWSRLRSVRAVVIAASTGGPKALETLVPELQSRIELPLLIVQHMPPRFTQSFAESLNRLSPGTVVEAQDGEPVRARSAYVAPGGKHLLLRQEQGRLLTAVNDQPPENGCRPSADVLFRAAAATLQGNVVAIVLTGMGRDGTAGVGSLKRGGGYVIAQDEATSVVWGMPGSVAEAGLADEVLPLGEIAAAVAALVVRTEA
jgi:two-component system chemotaxis response regulator CheB